VGFASYPFSPAQPDARSWEQVVALAVQALYRAKRVGGNRWPVRALPAGVFR